MIEDVREKPVAPAIVPACLASLVDGHAWARDTVGESGGSVYRLQRDGGPSLYLKHGRGDVARDITDEMVRLRWLTGRVPVPDVRGFVALDDEAWLLMTALPGTTAYQRLAADAGDRDAIVDALAAFLRQFHAMPVEACPFNGDHRLRLVQARERIEAGAIDTDDFDEEREGWTAEQVWDEMMELLPLAPDPVVTHGDFSLDNILMEGDTVTGCIDVARAGVADRYQDLAILCNGLRDFDTSLQDRLLAAYGIGNPDQRKLRFHLALDECF